MNKIILKNILCPLLFLAFSTKCLRAETKNINVIDTIKPILIPAGTEIFKICEELPRFPACDKLPEKTKNELEVCASEEMVKFINANLVYPPIAKENGVTGLAIVRFVVTNTGELASIQLVRDPGLEMGKAAMDVFHLMNLNGIKWIPAKQGGVTVYCQKIVPVHFKLP